MGIIIILEMLYNEIPTLGLSVQRWKNREKDGYESLGNWEKPHCGIQKKKIRKCSKYLESKTSHGNNVKCPRDRIEYSSTSQTCVKDKGYIKLFNINMSHTKKYKKFS